MPETLIHSSNIVTARIADELGGERLKADDGAAGLERAARDRAARARPLWPSGEWARSTTMTVSYGHGIAVTPLHLASAYAALVNGGIWRPATLLQARARPKCRAGRRVFKARPARGCASCCG